MALSREEVIFWRPFVEKGARMVASKAPMYDREDMVQDVWALMMQDSQSRYFAKARKDKGDDHNFTPLIANVCRRLLAQEIHAYELFKGAYIYTPANVKRFLEDWEDIKPEERADIDSAMKAMKRGHPLQYENLQQKYFKDERDVERKALGRAIDTLTEYLNSSKKREEVFLDDLNI